MSDKTSINLNDDEYVYVIKKIFDLYYTIIEQKCDKNILALKIELDELDAKYSAIVPKIF